MNRQLRMLGFVAFLAGAGCAAQHEAPDPTVPLDTHGARGASPMAPAVDGIGVEALVVQVQASPGEVHEALVAVGAQRDTTPPEAQARVEVLVIDEAVLDPVLRAVHPVEVPVLTWLGMPVRWVDLKIAPDVTLQARGWVLSLEAGDGAVVDLAMHAPARLRRERMVLPGQVLLMAPGGGTWPLDADDQPLAGPLASGGARGTSHLVVFRPRFVRARMR